MKFKCNNTEYKIIEKERLENEEDVGLTDYQNKQVLLKKLDEDFMIKTLKHELMHVWMYEYGHNQDEKEFNNEDICGIVACSNDFINEVVEEYKKEISLNKKWEKRYKDDCIDALEYAIESINKKHTIRSN